MSLTLRASTSQRQKKRHLLEGWSMVWLGLFTFVGLFFSFLPGSNLLHLQLAPEAAYLPPFQSSQYPLGTDQLGRNVLLYLLESCRTAWLLTFPPLAVSTSIGVVLGWLAGYYGDQGFRCLVRPVCSAVVTVLITLGIYPFMKWQEIPLLIGTSSFAWAWALVFTVPALFLGVNWCLRHIPLQLLNASSISLPFEALLEKLMNIWSTLPKLLLLLLLSSLTSPSMEVLMGWIAVSYWVLPARLVRSKVMETKQTSFIEAAKAQGLTTSHIFRKHFLPLLKGPLLTNFCFTASGLLGLGVTLSYLGVGLPPELPSWGRMLSNARLSVEAWWLLVFPALFLLLTIFSLQTLGKKISNNYRP